MSSRELYQDWERAAYNLVKAGYERQPERSPYAPVTFRQNEETVKLVRLTPESEWTVKVLEPLENREALFDSKGAML